MLNAGNIAIVATALTATALITLLAFFFARRLTTNVRVIGLASGFLAPSLIVGIGVGLAWWNPDPHGWVLTALLMLASLCLPISLLTSDWLIDRYAERDVPNG